MNQEQPRPRLPVWVLSEPVDVTAIDRENGCLTQVFLLERVNARILPGHEANALVVTFDDDQVMLNGRPLALTDKALEALCSLVDRAGQIAAPDNIQPIGMTIRAQAERITTP